MPLLRHLVVLVAMIAGGLAALSFPVRSDRIWVDAVTGSMKSQTSWLFYSTPPRIEPSAIGRWSLDHGGGVLPDWHFLTRAERNVFGQIVGRGCAGAPEIYPLRNDLNDRYVRAASDAEIGEFVRVMRRGTTLEKEQAVQGACQKAAEDRGQ